MGSHVGLPSCVPHASTVLCKHAFGQLVAAAPPRLPDIRTMVSCRWIPGVTAIVGLWLIAGWALNRCLAWDLGTAAVSAQEGGGVHGIVRPPALCPHFGGMSPPPSLAHLLALNTARVYMVH